MLSEIRHSIRSLRKNPGYAIAAILTLALGIGANTAIFSALQGVVLSPLPFREAERLVVLALYNRNLKYSTYTSYPDFLDWQRNSRSFEAIAAYKPLAADLSYPGTPEHLEGNEVSSNFFQMLGVKLALGRAFSEQEDHPGGAAVAIISDRLWRERFGRSPDAIGKTITLNGDAYTITGVLREGFRFWDHPMDVVTPIGRTSTMFGYDRTVHDLLGIGRLAPGVNLAQAEAEMNSVQQQIDALNPNTEKGEDAWVRPLKEEFVGDTSSTLLLLLGAVALVLLIACANVANLLLARSAARAREFAVRRALGAKPRQIIQQVITESLLLAMAGGLVGLAIAKWGLRAVLAAAPGTLPRSENIALSVPVLLYALGVSIAAGILFALVPALKFASSDLNNGLKEGGRGNTGTHRRAQNVLATAQIALALVLLSGASLLFRTIQNLWAVHPGFDTQHILTFQIGLSPSVTRTAPEIRAAYQRLTDSVRQISGVEAADITALVPLNPNKDNSGPFWTGPQPPASIAQIPRALYYPTGPDYPRAMQIPLLRGRYLTRADTTHSQLVVLIDDVLARTHFAGKDPLAASITIPHWGAARNVQARVAGVVRHVAQYGLDGSGREKPEIYFSIYQLPDDALPVFRSEISMAVRTPLPSAELMPAVQRAISNIASDEPIYNVRSMRELVRGSMSRQRFPMVLLGAFAVLALLLASIGIYAVISYSTARRVSEIGIRMALGASKSSVLRLLLGEGLRLGFAGVLIGAIGAFILTRALRSFSHLLYGVHAGDPLTLAAVSLCLIGSALLACYVPARRATCVDPMIALRHE